MTGTRCFAHRGLSTRTLPSGSLDAGYLFILRPPMTPHTLTTYRPSVARRSHPLSPTYRHHLTTYAVRCQYGCAFTRWTRTALARGGGLRPYTAHYLRPYLRLLRTVRCYRFEFNACTSHHDAATMQPELRVAERLPAFLARLPKPSLCAWDIPRLKPPY